MHTDFDSPLWRKLKARALLRVDQHIRALKRPGAPMEKTEELRGRIDELERLIALEERPSDEIETTPLP